MNLNPKSREPYYSDDQVELHHGDSLEVAKTLKPKSVQTIVTSPPYFGLRDYGEDAQLGAESSVTDYVANMVTLFHSLRNVLTDDGTLWLNLGDSYTGSRGGPNDSTGEMANRAVAQHRQMVGTRVVNGIASKNLIGVPWRVAFALQDDGWILRSEIIWHKPNPMPESMTDRPTKSHETIFLLTKSARYFYDADAIAEEPTTDVKVKPWRERVYDQSFLPAHQKQDGTKGRPSGPAGYGEAGRNKRTVWTVATSPFPGAHFAVYPPELIRPCILAGSRPGDTVLDPFSGSGTTGMVAQQEGRKYVGIDLNREYLDLSLRTRFAQPTLNFDYRGSAVEEFESAGMKKGQAERAVEGFEGVA